MIPPACGRTRQDGRNSLTCTRREMSRDPSTSGSVTTSGPSIGTRPAVRAWQPLPRCSATSREGRRCPASGATSTGSAFSTSATPRPQTRCTSTATPPAVTSPRSTCGRANRLRASRSGARESWRLCDAGSKPSTRKNQRRRRRYDTRSDNRPRSLQRPWRLR